MQNTVTQAQALQHCAQQLEYVTQTQTLCLDTAEEIAAVVQQLVQEAVLGLLAACLTVTWLAYRRKSKPAYWVGAAVISIASFIFLVYALLLLVASSFLMAFLMIWACLGSSRRVATHFHPGYKHAYHNTTEIIPD